MVSPRPNGRLIWEKWVRNGVRRSLKYRNIRGGSGQDCLLTDPQNLGERKQSVRCGKICKLAKELEGIQGSLCTSIQALSDSQKINRRCPWIWWFSKPCTWNRRPDDDCGCTSITCKCNNKRQGGNGKHHKNQYDTLPEPYPSTRGNFGALQAAEDTTGPD